MTFYSSRYKFWAMLRWSM